jgi:hypothetical protein
MAIGPLERATFNPGIANRLASQPAGTPDLPPLWGLLGQSAIPDALADALTSELELGDAILHGPAERIYPLAKRLVATWEFLLDAQSQSRRDPRDGALLVTDELTALAEVKSIKLVTTVTGEAIPVVSREETASLPAWAPSRFPPRMAQEAVRRYPKRPHDVGQIPPFDPKNVRLWQAILDQGPQRSASARPGAGSDAFAPIPIVDEPARRPGNEHALRAATQATGVVKTPTIAEAVRLLSSLSLRDLSRATGVTFTVPDLDAKLVGLTEIILYHSVYTVVLDGQGEPFDLHGRLDYPILVPEPGSQMQRNCPPPGVYISVQKYGDGSFRIGEGPITKLLFGGAGSFVEYGYGYSGPHEFQTTIQRYLDALGRSYIASVSTRSLFQRRDITIDSISDTVPRLVEAALPFTVREVTSRLEKDIEDYPRFLASLAEELVRTLIHEQIRERVRDYLVKKLGPKVIPFLNAASAVYDAVAGAEERMRVRHALAAVILALKGTSSDDMTISAKVLSKVMADEVYERIRQGLVNRGAKLAKHAARHVKPQAKVQGPAPDAPPEAPPEPKAPEPTIGNAAVDARGNVTHQKPVPKPYDPFDKPLSAQEIAEVERLQAARKQKEAEQARKTGDTGAGDTGTGATGTGHRQADPEHEEHPAGQGGFRIGESRIEGDAATATGSAATATGSGATATGSAATAPASAGTSATGTAAAASTVQAGSSGTPTRRRTLVEPGKPAVPSSTGDPLEFQTPIGLPRSMTIGGAPVVSRHPGVLLGARKDHFRQDVAKVIAADPHHPMRAMLDPSTLGSGKPEFVSTPHGRGGQRETEWRRHPEDWQAGHARSSHAGDADVLVLQTRYGNQLQNALHETGRRGEVTTDRVVVIGHIAVEYHSAWDLWHHGFIDLSWDEMNDLPVLPL